MPSRGGAGVTEAAEAATTLRSMEHPSPVRIRKLGHIVLQVRDLERPIRLYEAADVVMRLAW